MLEVKACSLTVAILGLALLLPAASGFAQTAPTPQIAASGANLNISPKRVTFDRNHRSGSVFIFNQGRATGTFDISLVSRVMLPDGQILSVAEAQSDPASKAVADRVNSAESLLQISPRRVTLNPGQGQTIRLRIANPAQDTGVSEFRSHLTVTTLPPREAGTTAEAAAADTPARALSFQINALFGLSVPVIVRTGDVDVRAAVQNPKLVMQPQAGATAASPGPLVPILTLDLVRLGTNSLFGNIEVRVQGQPRSELLGAARGVGVYPEIDRRVVRIALTRPPAPGEHLEITFADDDTSPGKVLANSIL